MINKFFNNIKFNTKNYHSALADGLMLSDVKSFSKNL